MDIDIKYFFSKNEQTIFTDMEDGPALIDPYRRTLIKLNPAAHRIWQLLDGKNSAEDIIGVMEAEFEIDERTLRRDVIDFLKDLIRREIIK
jgi:hypothetical protein